ncbi:TPA: hypothetical protein ACP32N_003285 [Pseudomonas aeruginosa]
MLKWLKNKVASAVTWLSQWIDRLVRREKARWLRLSLFAVIGVVAAGGILAVKYGENVGLNYMATASGLLLVVWSLLARHKFVQDLMTLAGVFLTAYWYVHTLPDRPEEGSNPIPIQHLLLDSTPQSSGYYALVKVKDGLQGKVEDCSFRSETSTLTCAVRIVPVQPEKQRDQ